MKKHSEMETDFLLNGSEFLNGEHKFNGKKMVSEKHQVVSDNMLNQQIEKECP